MTLLFGDSEQDLILHFSGEYDWLSNFYPVVVNLEGLNFPTVEHAYVAAKTTNYMDRVLITEIPANQAGKAKRWGRKFKLRDDWEIVKISIMRKLLEQKFQNVDLRQKLIATGDKTIVEGNHWHDNFWGTCMCDRLEPCKYHGKNMLGKLIMEIRDKIK